MKFVNSLNAWGKPEFSETFKKEIQDIDGNLLPLQQGLSLSSYVSDNPVSATILNTSENGDAIIVKTGLFYTGIIAGCSCADDPTPLDEQNEYCEVQITICKNTAETTAVLIEE
ncbi:MAG: hypothetical protein P8Y24_09975 [Gammaproteobacteria bacterium]